MTEDGQYHWYINDSDNPVSEDEELRGTLDARAAAWRRNLASIPRGSFLRGMSVANTEGAESASTTFGCGAWIDGGLSPNVSFFGSTFTRKVETPTGKQEVSGDLVYPLMYRDAEGLYLRIMGAAGVTAPPWWAIRGRTAEDIAAASVDVVGVHTPADKQYVPPRWVDVAPVVLEGKTYAPARQYCVQWAGKWDRGAWSYDDLSWTRRVVRISFRSAETVKVWNKLTDTEIEVTAKPRYVYVPVLPEPETRADMLVKLFTAAMSPRRGFSRGTESFAGWSPIVDAEGRLIRDDEKIRTMLRQRATHAAA